MGETIDQSGRYYLADTAKVIRVKRVDIPAFELRGALRHAVEHLIGAIKEMNRAKDKIELVTMLLDPLTASRRMDSAIIQLDPSPNSQTGISFLPPIEPV